MFKKKHGHTHNNGRMSRTYVSWTSMKQRCTNTKQEAYKRYNGVSICDRWINSFVAFLEDMGERPEKMTLDRIDNEKGYCKENCRWATNEQQANNKTNTIYVKYWGKIIPLTELAKKVSVSSGTIRHRLLQGWNVNEAIGRKEHKIRPLVSDFNIPDIHRREQMRWLKEKGCTLEDIGRNFSISRERVRQIIK